MSNFEQGLVPNAAGSGDPPEAGMGSCSITSLGFSGDSQKKGFRAFKEMLESRRKPNKKIVGDLHSLGLGCVKCCAR